MGLDFMDNSGVRVDYENALINAGFGKFHIYLLIVCGMIYMNTAIGITIISFVLPSATCDFRMSSSDKGLLTAAPMLGMLVGSYWWGCLADTKGRKTVLIATLLLDGFCGLLSSVAQYYYLFMLFRFFNGFGVAGAMGICFPYLGEFQPTKYREKILCWMEMFWTVGIIALPAIAWLIIPLNVEIRHGWFLFHSWNLFVAICAIPSLLLGCLLFLFPESPKFLIECGETEEALEVLRHMYQENTGKGQTEYPIKSLKERESISTISRRTSKSVRTLSMKKPKELKMLMSEIWQQTKLLCKPPHLRNTVLTCAIQFGLTTSYYTLMIWFPELFYRFEEFEKHNANKSASVCDVSSVVLEPDVNGTLVYDEYCDGPTIDNNVYIHTIIIGISCIPTSLWLPLCVHRLGAKFFLVFSLVVAGTVTIGLYFVHNSVENLILSCIFEALTSLGISTVYCVMVDLFPTNLRVMAAALSLTFGRGGALIGNLIFGFLIDLNCVIPIVLFSTMLFISGFLCLLLPNTGGQALD
ncbi:synaptic vesicle glycoprotein 2C-like [Sitodiplosis mosellana]|uniref:synaptic vesicle glycoprotein 2C-like n=1 Tax=Sitodiplosis mosellana TaxID=263140 RepID=UPI002444025A|nr:synaptic vesicle glycoprotein 2C-like [Sitodiplosis mosellana]XP_055324514.1 synaptic vesicle glycoprotein 2C-like [Sitodiplosis mosellana]XP_055324515.1 synaptic vesicle glycoprotein 2C-like [Sitodiplosis mosellana]XP_055324516.1 synaptic vesicle glycoprotein 2C-like [Sitodiplosis mosellana]XP_055324517.1 synaptic vesicle glycoprotein 2C-like [Sitodiplosis mosellana]